MYSQLLTITEFCFIFTCTYHYKILFVCLLVPPPQDKQCHLRNLMSGTREKLNEGMSDGEPRASTGSLTEWRS